MVRILAITLFLFKLYFTAITNFSPGFLRGHSARQPAPNTDGSWARPGDQCDGASFVRAFISEVRLGTSEHDVIFVIAAEHAHRILLYVHSIYA